MVSEEDCPLQECQCAELPHQVSPVFFPTNIFFPPRFCSLIFQFPVFLIRTLTTLFLPPLPNFLPVCGASNLSLVAQLEGRPGSVCSHPQTQTRPHRLLQTEEGAQSFSLCPRQTFLYFFFVLVDDCLAGHAFPPQKSVYIETNVSCLLCSVNHLGDVSLCRTTPLGT